MNKAKMISKAVGSMLGAATGDALGWPNELIGYSKNNKRNNSALFDFQEWKRKAGGRYYSHEEIIWAGEYSDDTQLILCLSRSLQKGVGWWEHWTRVELPFWLLYERGGGRATKRSAEAWSDSISPWSIARNSKDVLKYIEAGGNGVAMRILPHAIYNINSNKYDVIADNIMRDGIATHGHPRALLSALCYGYALWKILNKSETLGYGKIIEELLDEKNIWSVLPVGSEDVINWLETINQLKYHYDNLWSVTNKEMESLLSQCLKEIKKGTLVIDDEVLANLNCFNKNVNGAGTIAVAASAFLASRYAPDPIHGITKAAFSYGADTDTIASMTGALLGAICGSEWLVGLKDKIQNSIYIEKNAQNLANQEIDNSDFTYTKSVSKAMLGKWIDDLVSKQNKAAMDLPDGRRGVVNVIPDYIAKSGNYKIQFRKVTCGDGQTLYFKKIKRGDYKPGETGRREIAPIYSNESIQSATIDINIGTKLVTKSFRKAVAFYKDVIGLNIKRQSNETVFFEPGLVIVLPDYGGGCLSKYQFKTILCVEVHDIHDTLQRVKESKYCIVNQLDKWQSSGRLFFRCLDPDENVVEVFAKDAYQK